METEEVRPVPKGQVSNRLTRTMNEEDAKSFTASYGRAKKVLSRINEYAGLELERKQTNIENPKAFELANWSHYVAWTAGYRAAMRVTQDLTRT